MDRRVYKRGGHKI
ncbi:BnaCnng30280D [Brassica napus]|uniref:BnaCnng30280D protein n=2 Tax=Brassica TaxID=3705 RepID=A0A078J087_BRANA|nr:BnaCnng30280D [Brassica napus]